tara:strand:+ start:1167 stop:2132 length:966 start_codon:yes stop_codon:yes gene_type:complete
MKILTNYYLKSYLYNCKNDAPIDWDSYNQTLVKFNYNLKENEFFCFKYYYFKEIKEVIKVQAVKKLMQGLFYLITNADFYNENDENYLFPKINLLNKLSKIKYSSDELSNNYQILFNENLLPKKIIKLYRIDINNSYSEELKQNILNNRILFHLYGYGFNNILCYSISFQDFFNLDFQNLEQYFIHNFQNITKINLAKISKNKLKHKLNQFVTDYYLYKYQQTKEYYIESEKINNKYFKNISKTKTYLMKNKLNGLYKIGKSINPKYRESTLQSQEPEIQLIKVWEEDIENKLHTKYKKHRKRGEWFELNKVQVKYICTKY